VRCFGAGGGSVPSGKAWTQCPRVSRLIPQFHAAAEAALGGTTGAEVRREPVRCIRCRERIWRGGGYFSAYSLVGLVVVLGVLFVAGAFAANRLLRPDDRRENTRLRCGVDPVGEGWAQHPDPLLRLTPTCM